ncbi:hypothetical protein K437DRAFT_267210 [Tilletiaria anomala UBC 951]|uniref:BAH-domain-containing protein n=1 Tax=Tilletiaria anomala (strain ATCC 24038 / CBS 436.72 / UBC 951) TaxID=1037660 RepID=A0A066WA52_TILAU|nr:uncharacterized protein K437DRAFT_267210 [Tilletiaria anomala UBC 951]KDN50827.1 hypothetical protein K437DRAFT_267210 [Tilletiaria anomala UBC 951]
MASTRGSRSPPGNKRSTKAVQRPQQQDEGQSQLAGVKAGKESMPAADAAQPVQSPQSPSMNVAAAPSAAAEALQATAAHASATAPTSNGTSTPVGAGGVALPVTSSGSGIGAPPAVEARVPDPEDQGWVVLPPPPPPPSLASTTATDDVPPAAAAVVSLTPPGSKRGRGRKKEEIAATGSSTSRNDGCMSEADVAERVFGLLLDKLRAYRYKSEESGSLWKQISSVLEFCPDRQADPEYYQKIERPISLSSIETRVKAREYADGAAFEQDMMQLFENVRSLFDARTDIYGEMLVLQRFYQELVTWRKGSNLAEVEAHIDAVASAGMDDRTFFCTVPVGPGYATQPPPGFGEGMGAELLPSTTAQAVLASRISARDKVLYEHAVFKGHTFRAGDWVHMINPSEPAKPIIGQVFKAFQRHDQPGQYHLTVCWYYRPEDTVHPPSRQFFENEVFKTGIMVDHRIQDVLEKTCVMFYTRYIRGRPVPEPRPRSDKSSGASRSSTEPYVTESRYNEQQRIFNKIKSWNSCVPEEVRKTEMPMVLFDKPMPAPPRFDSPFLASSRKPGVPPAKGPGLLCREEDVKKPGAVAAGGGNGEHEFPDLFKVASGHGAAAGAAASGEENGDSTSRKRKRERERERREAKRARELQMQQQQMQMPHLSSGGMDVVHGLQAQQQQLHHADTPAAHAKIYRDLAGQLAHRIGPQAAGHVEALLTGPQGMGIDLRQLAHSLGPSADVQLLAHLRDAASRAGLINSAASLPGHPHVHVHGHPPSATGTLGVSGLSASDVYAAAAAPAMPSNSAGPGAVAVDGLGLDASVMSAMHGSEAFFDSISVEARALFARDPVTDQPLWFAGAPLDVGVNAAAAVPVDQLLRSPTPSLEYVYHHAIRESAATSSQGNASSPLTPSSLSESGEWGDDAYGIRFASFSGSGGTGSMLPLSPATTAFSLHEGDASAAFSTPDDVDQLLKYADAHVAADGPSIHVQHALKGLSHKQQQHHQHHAFTAAALTPGAPSEHEHAFGTPDLFQSDFSKIYDGAHYTPLSAFLGVED